MQPELYQDENLLARLDRMPMTRTAFWIIALLSLVWIAEAFDIGIIGPVMTILKDVWHLSKSQLGLLGVSSTIGIVVGLIPSGIIADRLGRRTVVLGGIAWFSVLTVLGAFAPNFWFLFVIRLLAGVGAGAIFPMPYLFLAEFVRAKRRAVSVGYSNGVLTAAYLIPSLSAVWAINAFPVGISWRIPFLLGGLPLVLLIPLALWLPESPRFLLKRGRRAEVTQLVEKLERQAGLLHDTTLINQRALAVIHQGAVRKPTLRALMRPPYVTRGVIAAAQLTGAFILFYILLVFGPTILMERGFGSGNAILFTGVMMAIAGIGSITQGYLADRLGRKWILTVYFFLAAIGCAMFGLFTSPGLVIAAGLLTSFFGLGVFPVSKLYLAEQFPTRLRGGGVYFGEMTARILSGVVTIYSLPFLLHLWGNRVIFEAIAIALLVLALPFVLWGRETARISVEEAGTDMSFAELDSEFEPVPGTKLI